MSYALNKVGNLIKYTDSSSDNVGYFSPSAIPDLFSYNTTTNTVTSRIAGQWDTEIPIAQLTIDGNPITNESDFDTAISNLTKSTTSGGGGGVTIYTGDGTIDASETGGVRTIHLGDNQLIISSDEAQYIFDPSGSLQLNYNGINWLFINTQETDEEILITSWSSEEPGHYTQIASYAGSDVGGIRFILESNRGSDGVVRLEGNATTNELIYTAATHTFNGDIVAGDSGALEISAPNGVDASDFFSVGSVPGISDTLDLGVVTSITVVGGIITAAA